MAIFYSYVRTVVTLINYIVSFACNPIPRGNIVIKFLECAIKHCLYPYYHRIDGPVYAVGIRFFVCIRSLRFRPRKTLV